MSSCTDPLGLNENRLFKDLKNCLPEVTHETKNILEIRDDVLYVWNAKAGSILTLNVSAIRSKDVNFPYQKLQPTDPPLFEVSSILINETGTQMVLWGNLGIVVFEIPKRWGKLSNFHGGKEVITCVSHNLDGCCSNLSTSEVRKVRWHPASVTDSHLVVLTSDNVFQLYECDLGDTPRLLRTWKVGPSGHSPSKIPNFTSLGDAAVDFDFASPSVKHDYDREIEPKNVGWKDIEWPILVLRGNGDVLMVRGNVLNNVNKPVVYGSLSMLPPAVDNYGIDSCSIMCLPTTPPIVIIASCSGKIYHAILLHENLEEDEKKTWSQYGSTYSLHTPEEALYVYECVEMELGLFYTDNDKKYTCPINLHSDRANNSRYFCSHNAGIHVVNVPMVQQLNEYVNADENANLDLYLPKLDKQSSAQYLVSTRTKYMDKEEATPTLGFGLLQEPCVLIALLHTGRVIDISIVDYYDISKVETSSLVPASPSKKVTKESFDSYVKQLLKRETSQPITMIGLRQNLSPRESLELLVRATSIFRKQYFVHQNKVREEFGKKIRTLTALKNHQLKELEALGKVKKNLHAKAESLAERYEDIKDYQEILARTAEKLLRLAHLKDGIHPKERAEMLELEKMRDKIKELNVRLEQTKKKKMSNLMQINETEKRNGKAEIVLKQSQIDALKDTLHQMGKEINEVISRVKTLQEQVD